MKIPSINDLIRSKLLLAGLLFIGVNLTYSHLFYQVNSFKVLFVLTGVSILAFWNDLIFPGNVEKRVPWKQLIIVAIPLLATLPGYFWHQGKFNYNFHYELTANLVLIVWIVYLYRGVRHKQDLNPFFFLIGITVIYAGIWALLERIGFHPLFWYAGSVSRVKSTFGNINYFAGFLVVLIPVLLSFCLPEKLPQPFSFRKLYPSHNRGMIFYLVVLIIAGLSLILTQTRAAQGATLVSLVVFVFFYVLSFTAPAIQKRIYLIGACFILLSILVITLLFLFADILPQNRYTLLFTLEGWTPRFAGWGPAINSIKASPLIGFGLGSSYNLYFAFTDPNARLYHGEHSYNHVHSEFLEYTQEGGLLGLALFIAFWCYLAYLLIRIARSDQVDPFLKKLAIGIIGGFVAYHIHSAFDVAPRMMVMKLPLATLIGLTLIINKLTVFNHNVESNKDFKGKSISFLPALVLLGYTWVIFTPWLIGQYRFVDIQRTRPSLLTVERLEKMVEGYPDIYALDYLSRLQIQYKRTNQLQKTVSLIDKMLPDYRELGHTKAVLAILQQDLTRAKKTALAFQDKQDKYFSSTIYLLMGLAFDTNDYRLFKDQFQLFIRKLVFDHKLYYSLNATDVVVAFGEVNLPFRITHQNDRFAFDWNEKLIRSIFDVGRSVRLNTSFTQKDRNTFVSFMAYHISHHPYFQLTIKQEFREQDSVAINEKMNTYFINSQQWQKKSKELTGKHQNELARTPVAARPALEKKQREEKSKAAEPFQAKMEECSDFLDERTDWTLFLKKRGFTTSFLEDMAGVIYPMVMTRN